jgi:hypothetical protein
MNPADPIEGVLISQIVIANEAALSMYRRAWACPPDHYFEAVFQIRRHARSVDVPEGRLEDC